MEDWVIWNWNENLDMSTTIDATKLGFDIIVNSVHYTVERLMGDNSDIGNSTLGDTHIEELGVNDQYYIMFDEKPTLEFETKPLWETKHFSTYTLEEKLLPPTEQYSISIDDVDEEYYHEKIKDDFDENTHFYEYKKWFEDNIINELNKDFIEEYGYDELGHDYEQGFHQIEDIRRENLEISYYELNNNIWTEIEENRNDEYLINFNEIKTKIKVNDNNVFFKKDQEISLTFEPSNEIINYNKRSKLIRTTSLTIFVIFILIIVIIASLYAYFVVRPKNNKKEN